MVTTGPARRPGGRSARVRAAVLRATLEEVAARGFGRLSIEAVAARANVHKTTIYRRWPTRAELLVEALLERSSVEVPMPDTGAIRDDLRALMHSIVANLQSPIGAGIVRALAEVAEHDDIRAAALEFWRERFALVTSVIERAVRRGQLPRSVDAALLIESLIGPLYLRLLVTMEPLDDAFADRVVDFAMQACRA